MWCCVATPWCGGCDRSTQLLLLVPADQKECFGMQLLGCRCNAKTPTTPLIDVGIGCKDRNPEGLKPPAAPCQSCLQFVHTGTKKLFQCLMQALPTHWVLGTPLAAPEKPWAVFRRGPGLPECGGFQLHPSPHHSSSSPHASSNSSSTSQATSPQPSTVCRLVHSHDAPVEAAAVAVGEGPRSASVTHTTAC